MEMQQMIECLLASQEQMMANRKADQERMERQVGSLVSMMVGNRKTDRDEMKQEIRAGQEHIKEIMEMQFGSLATKLDGW
jgi:Fe2+ transport system protein B